MQILQQSDTFQVRFWDLRINTLLLPGATHSPSLWLDNSLRAKEFREGSLIWNLICCQNYSKNKRKLYSDRSNCSVSVHKVQNSNTETLHDSGTHLSRFQISLTAPQVSWHQTTNILLSCMKTVLFSPLNPPRVFSIRRSILDYSAFSEGTSTDKSFSLWVKTLSKFMGPDKELKILQEQANGAVEMKFLESQNNKIIKAEKRHWRWSSPTIATDHARYTTKQEGLYHKNKSPKEVSELQTPCKKMLLPSFRHDMVLENQGKQNLLLC